MRILAKEKGYRNMTDQEHNTMTPVEAHRVQNVKSVLIQLRLLREPFATVALLAYITKLKPGVVLNIFNFLENKVGALKNVGHKFIAGSVRNAWKVDHLLCQQMLDHVPGDKPQDDLLSLQPETTYETQEAEETIK